MQMLHLSIVVKRERESAVIQDSLRVEPLLFLHIERSDY